MGARIAGAGDSGGEIGWERRDSAAKSFDEAHMGERAMEDGPAGRNSLVIELPKGGAQERRDWRRELDERSGGGASRAQKRAALCARRV